MYTYQATLVKIVDGDTINVIMDLGFHLYFKTPIRFAGINAPEMSTPEGPLAKAYLEKLIGDQTELMIISEKNPKEKYGRWLGTVKLIGRRKTLNDQMVAAGHAVPFMVDTLASDID